MDIGRYGHLDSVADLQRFLRFGIEEKGHILRKRCRLNPREA